MRNSFITFFLMLSLSSCSYLQIHKNDIQQGNILNAEEINSLHLGMSVNEVKKILGNPLLTNVFNENRVDYVYTYKPGYGNNTEKNITLVFQNSRLYEIKGNMYSAFMKN